MERAVKGIVFNIQHFSIHDGPGIRSVVFLKGCPLRCEWCANPESQNFLPEAGWTSEECMGCKDCVRGLTDLSCSFGEEGLFWDTGVSLDSISPEIGEVCPTGAFHRIGEEMTVDEVLDEVEKDLKFYENSEGGLTLSGGEPLAQADFAAAVLEEAGNRHIHRCVETCGCVSPEIIKRVTPLLDCIIADVKLLDEEEHIRWTRASNRQILENLHIIRRLRPELPMLIRTPVIPGVNDREDVLERIATLAHDLDAGYEILKYHRLGLSKYRSLHREYPMGDAELSESRFEELKSKIMIQ